MIEGKGDISKNEGRSLSTNEGSLKEKNTNEKSARVVDKNTGLEIDANQTEYDNPVYKFMYGKPRMQTDVPTITAQEFINTYKNEFPDCLKFGYNMIEFYKKLRRSQNADLEERSQYYRIGFFYFIALQYVDIYITYLI